MYFSCALYTGEGDKTNTMRFITISNHKLFTSLNRAEPFDTFQESRVCFWPSYWPGTIHLGCDDGKLPTWPPGGHTDGKESERLQITTLWWTLSLKRYVNTYFSSR